MKDVSKMRKYNRTNKGKRCPVSKGHHRKNKGGGYSGKPKMKD